MLNPKVSVVITAHNLEKFIEEAIQSVLNQTYRDFEIIVVNNGSTDKTKEIIERLSESHHNIRLINQENRGEGGGRNTGIRFSRGEFIAIMDGDDIWHKEKLKLQVKALEENPNAGLVSCFAAVIDNNSRLTGWRVGKNLNGNVFRNVSETNGIPCGSAPLIRKYCFDKVGLFKEYLLVSDWDFFIRLSEYFPIITLPRILVGYRRHSTNLSKNYDELECVSSTILDNLFKDKNRFTRSFSSKCYSGSKYIIAVLCTIDGEYDLAIKNLKKSFFLSPLNSFLKPDKVIFALLLLSFKTFPLATSWLVNMLHDMTGIKTNKEFKIVYG